jgi:hypothetical protein
VGAKHSARDLRGDEKVTTECFARPFQHPTDIPDHPTAPPGAIALLCFSFFYFGDRQEEGVFDFLADWAADVAVAVEAFD